MRVVVVAAIVLLSAPLTSWADAISLPQYDVDARCANRGHKEQTAYCLRLEQESYDALKFAWDSYSDKVKTYCKNLSDNNDYLGYSILLDCAIQQREIELQKEYIDNPKPFKP